MNGPRPAPPLLGMVAAAQRPHVLVLGVYLADRPNHIGDVVRKLFLTEGYQVCQKWVGLGGVSDDEDVKRTTVAYATERIPKFIALNEMLSQIALQRLEYLIVVDDDIRLPDRFLDRFLRAQTELAFALAQPARTRESYIDHLIVAQDSGAFARETRWVESGPVVSIHRSVFDLVLPFDTRSPMGWGLENVWAYELSQRRHRMGIIDAVPVEHTLRVPHQHYDAADAEAGLRRLHAERRHLPLYDCQQVLARYPAAVATPRHQQILPDEFLRILDEHSRAIGRSCYLLDWHSGVDLTSGADTFGDHIVFTSFDGPPAPLPYFGESIEVVLLSSMDPAAFKEAHRVARLAVVRPEQGRRLAIDWLLEPQSRRRRSVSVVIPTFNRAALLDECLAMLLPTLDGYDCSVEIIVVDDGSIDDTWMRVRCWSAGDARVKLLPSQRNEGFVDACNRGAAAACGEILVFLNNDARPKQGWLDAFLRVFVEHPEAGAVGGKLMYSDGRLQEAGSFVFEDGSAMNRGRGDTAADAPRYSYAKEVDYCSAALLATPRELFVALGGFDSRFAPAYYEDTDYCLRVRAAGRRVFYEPESIAVHIEGGTNGTDVAQGVKRFQQINREKFREKWRSVLPHYPARPEVLSDYEGTSSRSALVCAPVLPEFDRESGSRRLFDHIEILRAAGWDVVFAAENGRSESRYVRLLQRRGVETYCRFDGLEHLLLQRRFELALIAFWDVAEKLMPLIRRVSPNTHVLVDSIDLHFLRNARRVQPDWNPRVPRTFTPHEMHRELAVYAGADGVLTVSTNEADLLRHLSPAASPFVVADGDLLPMSSVPWPQRRGLLFLGNFRHAPNSEAAEYLLRDTVPRLDPSVRERHPIYIVGNDLPDHLRALASGLRDVIAVGWVPSIEPYLAYSRVFLAPLLHGAGTKRKLIQAMLAGTPTVATTIAIEGLPLRANEQLLVADDADGFAHAVTRLAFDDELCRSLSARGRAAIERVHSRDSAKSALIGAVDTVLGRRR